MSKKQIINTVVGVLSGIFGVASIITGVIASKDDQEMMYQELEDRYGLTPIEKDEE